MKQLSLLLLIFIYGCATSRKVDRYYFIAEEPIPLFEFASLTGRPILTVNPGDTIASTGPKEMKIGGKVPVDYKGYRFYSSSVKARLIGQTKIDAKTDQTAPGITYLPRMRLKQQTEAQLAADRQREEGAAIDWYGQVTYAAPVLGEPEAIAQTVYTLPANAIVKIKRHNYGYWQVEYEGKVGYLGYYYIYNFSKSASPFVKTAYTGLQYDPDEISPRYNTPTTGATIHTGPRGGRYYINSNGNKTYIPRSGSNSYRGYRSSRGRGRK